SNNGGATMSADASARRSVAFDLVAAPHTAGDPDNALLSLVPPEGASRAGFERALEDLLGKLDVVVDEGSDAALLDIAKRARARLPDALARWRNEERGGTRMMVKLPFPFEPPERSDAAKAPQTANMEWMWVQVTGFDETFVRGTLANSPS